MPRGRPRRHANTVDLRDLAVKEVDREPTEKLDEEAKKINGAVTDKSMEQWPALAKGAKTPPLIARVSNSAQSEPNKSATAVIDESVRNEAGK
ncbi:hypothetical protein A4A49_47649, partial [Nicotiana attenuata]